MSKKVLHTSQLQIGYPGNKGKAVAHDLNLHLHEGQLICLLGPNGTGKSTLLRTIAGIQPPLQGKVEIDDHDIKQLTRLELAKKLSIVLTETVATGNLTVYSLITLGRYPYLGWLGRLKPRDKAILKWAIKVCGVEDFLNTHINQLSDGERQKVMIARALAQETPVILLDEPTAHLDLPSRVETIRLLRKLARETGKAIILSTHELDLALQAGDRIWLMMPNQTMDEGTPEDLVLNGTFECAFQKRGFAFDKQSGTFKIHEPYPGKEVALKGDPAPRFWTQRALEREGFQITDKASITITASAEPAWTINDKQESEKITSIEALIKELRKKYAAL